MKWIKVLISTAVLFSTQTNVALADNDLNACEAVLCLSGGLFSQSGFVECTAAISRFANIKYYSSRGFEPEITRALRTNYLESCKDADKTFTRMILLTYGDKEY